ncbi:DUF4190 domain-containing protein [uncultured Cellulomonas sp.]|uniref:DUF4190 domain-containing protein n=1 Tax=uncultured Cellulomonas sp. TaxID=189682 RepID=UPI00261890F3|nr:DUF4190 domain-containing protein [uncultured Cellulomonas sp.]
MSSTNNPQDPYGTPRDPDSSGSGSSGPESSGSTSYGSGSTPPAYGSQPPAYGSQPPAYGSQPPAYGSQQDFGSAAPAYGAYGGSPYGQQGGTQRNSLGVWSLVLSLLSLTICSTIAPLLAIPGIVLGSKSRKAAASGEANNGGLGLAGVIIGVVALVLWVVGLLWLIFGGWAWYMDVLETSTGTTTF